MINLRRYLHCIVSVILFSSVGSVFAQQGPTALSSDPACKSMTPTSMGGIAPTRPTTVVLRWLGIANYELAYRNTVLLFDAYYTLPPRAQPLGFAREDIKKTDGLFIG